VQNDTSSSISENDKKRHYLDVAVGATHTRRCWVLRWSHKLDI